MVQSFVRPAAELETKHQTAHSTWKLRENSVELVAVNPMGFAAIGDRAAGDAKVIAGSGVAGAEVIGVCSIDVGVEKERVVTRGKGREGGVNRRNIRRSAN